MLFGHGPPTSPFRRRGGWRHSNFRWRRFHRRGELPHLECPCGRDGGEEMHHTRNHTGPSGLMAGAEPSPVIAVEILVEENEVTPVRVLLELVAAAVNRAIALVVPEKDAFQTSCDFFSDLV